jgi:hypothetical protein
MNHESSWKHKIFVANIPSSIPLMMRLPYWWWMSNKLFLLQHHFLHPLIQGGTSSSVTPTVLHYSSFDLCTSWKFLRMSRCRFVTGGSTENALFFVWLFQLEQMSVSIDRVSAKVLHQIPLIYPPVLLPFIPAQNKT